MQLQTKKTAVLGLLLALSLVLSYVEILIPIPLGIPGAKLGLPNMLIVLILYEYGIREAVLVNLMRIILSGFLFGNYFSILYSLAGGLLSLSVMAVLKKTGGFSVAGISIAGGVFHTYSSLIQLPKGTRKISEGTKVVITNDQLGEDERIQGEVMKFDQGQLHSRLWV